MYFYNFIFLLAKFFLSCFHSQVLINPRKGWDHYIPLYNFLPLMNIQVFMCSLVIGVTTSFSLFFNHRACNYHSYSTRFILHWELAFDWIQIPFCLLITSITRSYWFLFDKQKVKSRWHIITFLLPKQLTKRASHFCWKLELLRSNSWIGRERDSV